MDVSKALGALEGTEHLEGLPTFCTMFPFVDNGPGSIEPLGVWMRGDEGAVREGGDVQASGSESRNLFTRSPIC